MSMLQELHEAHLARRRRLGALSPVEKREPKPLVPGVKREIIAPIWATPNLMDITPKLKPGPCALEVMMGHGDNPPRWPTMASILEEVASRHQVTKHMILCKCRKQWIADIRQEFYYRVAAETIHSYPVIARFSGGREHTTILYGVSAYCSRHNLPHPRDARDNMYDRKQRQRERYNQVRAELRAQNEAQA